MELLTFAKEIAQSIAEHAASYKVGQTVLRQLDRALWVVEKCARWAVPPPLDQDDRPQPELVRPLPWVFFLAMLITLRITRESISLINLLLGKPPLRSADVVMYIQSKRRYLRTLKYQGNRIIRARTAPSQPREPWYSGLQSLFEFTMCFRRSYNYGNNNTTRVSNNDEVLVVKRSKRPREPASPVATTSETTMERLIEKMMVDLDAESDDDSSFTLTNVTGIRSDRSDSESEHETATHDDTLVSINSIENGNDNQDENGDVASSTPEKSNKQDSPPENNVANSTPEKDAASNDHKSNDSPPKNHIANSTPYKDASTEQARSPKNKTDISEPNPTQDNGGEYKNDTQPEDAALEQPRIPKKQSPKEDTKKFIQSERCSPQKSPSPKNTKIANGRTISAPKKRGLQTQRRDPDSTDHSM